MRGEGDRDILWLRLLFYWGSQHRSHISLRHSDPSMVVVSARRDSNLSCKTRHKSSHKVAASAANEHDCRSSHQTKHKSSHKVAASAAPRHEHDCRSSCQTKLKFSHKVAASAASRHEHDCTSSRQTKCKSSHKMVQEPPLAPTPKAVWFASQAAKAKSQSRAARRGERPPSWLPTGGEEARVSQEDFGSMRQLHPASRREEEEDPRVFWIPHVGKVRGSIAQSLRRRSLGDDTARSAAAHGRRKQRPHHQLVLVSIKPQRKRRTEPGLHHPNIDLGDPNVEAITSAARGQSRSHGAWSGCVPGQPRLRAKMQASSQDGTDLSERRRIGWR